MASKLGCRAASRLCSRQASPKWPFVCRRSTSTTSKGAARGRYTTTKAPPAPSSRLPRRSVYIAFGGLFAVAYALAQTSHLFLDAAHEATIANHQISHTDLPRYRIAEVKQHGAASDRPWIIHRDKVYDITDWIPAHPGGQVILRAAGGSIDAYWDIFSIHKEQYVYDILNEYLIGCVDPADLVDGRPAQEHIDDPFSSDPERDQTLATLTARPRNAETPSEALDASFLTPNRVFYVRNHMWVPTLDKEPDEHVLTVELFDGTTRAYTLRDLKTKFPQRTVAAVLQCSGNRRKDMSEGSGRKANGLPWSVGAISNATWSGVSLADVLRDAGFDLNDGMTGNTEVKHVHFAGLEAYAASIPLKKAIDPQGDVILAFSMNGEPLPRDHGFPLRAIVPGHVAARSVKWLNGITLSDEESTSQWQRRDYKCFGPNETKVDWDAAPAIQELPVQSAITGTKLGAWKVSTTSERGAVEPARQAALTGYAYSGGGRSIVRVDVSLDDGKTWSQAELLPDCVSASGKPSPCTGHAAWTWKRWRYNGDVPASTFREAENLDSSSSSSVSSPSAAVAPNITPQDPAREAPASAPTSRGPRRCTTAVVKATDEAYNTQPESHAATWNVRGNLATAWHRVQLCSECRPEADSPLRGDTSLHGKEMN